MNLFLFELLFLLCFPVVLAVGTSLLTWNALSRPGVFLLSAAMTLYALYAVSMWLFAPVSVGWTISYRAPGEPPEPQAWFPLLTPYKVPLVVFAIAAFPALAGLLRLFRKPRASDV